MATEKLVNCRNGAEADREYERPLVSSVPTPEQKHAWDVELAVNRLRMEALGSQVVADILTVLGLE